MSDADVLRLVFAIIALIIGIIFNAFVCNAIFGSVSREMLIGIVIGTGINVYLIFFLSQTKNKRSHDA